MAAYRRMHQFCSVLFGWTPCWRCAWICSSSERERALDWHCCWFGCAVNNAMPHYMLHKLEQTG